MIKFLKFVILYVKNVKNVIKQRMILTVQRVHRRKQKNRKELNSNWRKKKNKNILGKSKETKEMKKIKEIKEMKEMIKNDT